MKCRKCQIEKDSSEFSFRYKNKGVKHTICKSCKKVIDNDDYQIARFAHVRSTLKKKDPDLYKFIEHCINKYSK